MTDLFVGAATGALKGVNLSEDSFSNVGAAAVGALRPSEDGVARLCWADGDEGGTEVLCARLNRQLSLFDSLTAKHTPLFRADGGDGAVVGLHRSQDGSRVVTAVQSGVVRAWDADGAAQSEVQAGAELRRMRASPCKAARVATGGRENALKLWDLHSPDKPLFTAKNVRADWLRLRKPVWVNDLQFLADSENVATATGHHQIRVYDPRGERRRPVIESEWLDEPFTALSTCPHPSQLIAANSHGCMALFDLRKNARMMHVYRGFAGSIRDVVTHPTAPLVASCGVDRFVRLHHIDTRQLLHKVYCKARLNCVLMRRDLSILAKEGVTARPSAQNKGVRDSGSDDEGLSSDSDNDVWSEMPLVAEKARKRKVESATADETAAPKQRHLEPKKKRKAQLVESPVSDGLEAKRRKREAAMEARRPLKGRVDVATTEQPTKRLKLQQ